MRVALSQALLHAVDGLNAHDKSAVRRSIRAETLTEIEKSLAIGFIPMALHMELSLALREVVGSKRNVEVWHGTMRAAWDRPLLRGFVGTLTALFGFDPGSLFKQAGRVHQHLTHGIGDLVYEGDRDEACTIRLYGFPSQRFHFRCYVEGLEGCLASVFAVTGSSGGVEVREVDESAGEALYALHWSTRSSGRLQ